MPDYEPELVPSVDSFFFFLVLVIFATFNSMKKYGDLRENFTSILGSQSKRGERLPQDHHQIVEKECQPQEPGLGLPNSQFLFYAEMF